MRKWERLLFNPLVPRVQEIKVRNLTLNRLLIVEFVKKMVYLGMVYLLVWYIY